eukprot:CAMPEP_0113395114 /NCGR_PEP_ID=MMETSP0013_2-20120614/12967_1 /TAXON_ID=2843 ORGANISM="Skeletonema costatum, Strain 1716" /NCGR_SAMPLE_ID=MMETSP0013_2 /ASSEMBLY_ACC=CAM_ASM_000158 /LENGTH=366 /DNA_ID=CAMNT_0000279195 /DNA_START=2597 /DNA_END=3697 /DNA_ORIENTATION=+ /assembly_acc=CAM_ASM_000158
MENTVFSGDQSESKKALKSIHDEEVTHQQIRPFSMPIHGKKYEIFQPLYDMDVTKKNPQLFLPPKEFLGTFEERISWAGSMVQINDEEFKDLSPKEHAALMYIDMIKTFVSGRVFRNAELSVVPRLGPNMLPTIRFNEAKRDGGRDWTFAGDTMTGQKRLDNVHALLKDVIENKVIGDYIETGVWRGGSSVLAKAVLEVLDPNSNRVSYVCDSFMGLPPGEKKLSKKDAGWDNTPYLEVASDIVANNFIKYGLLDSNVIFAKGFFNETMPPLAEKIKSLSIMRLDGDMYESTVDVLYHLYDKLSIGGYVIMDDWFGFPSKTACEDFFAVHGIEPEIIPIDDISAYWKKAEDVQVQYWRYEQSSFTS